jgi:hypothetical protein
MMHRLVSFYRRNSAVIYLAIIAVSLIGIFLILIIANAKYADQINQQSQILKETKSIAQQLRDDSKSRDKQIDDLNRHLDCIVKFFHQDDPLHSSIENIQTCRITKNADTSTASPSSDQGTSAPSGTGLTSPTTQQPATQPRQQSQGGSSGTSGSGSSNGGTNNPPSAGNQQPVRQLLQDIISLPLALIRQIPTVGGKP